MSAFSTKVENADKTENFLFVSAVRSPLSVCPRFPPNHNIPGAGEVVVGACTILKNALRSIITRARPLAARVLKCVSLLSTVDCRQCHKQAP